MLRGEPELARMELKRALDEATFSKDGLLIGETALDLAEALAKCGRSAEGATVLQSGRGRCSDVPEVAWPLQPPTRDAAVRPGEPHQAPAPRPRARATAQGAAPVAR